MLQHKFQLITPRPVENRGIRDPGAKWGHKRVRRTPSHTIRINRNPIKIP